MRDGGHGGVGLIVARQYLPKLSVIKVTTRWVMTNQIDGMYQHSDVAKIANEILMTGGQVGMCEKLHSKQLVVGARFVW